MENNDLELLNQENLENIMEGEQSQEAQINKDRLKKFQEMGIPMPLIPVGNPIASSRPGNSPVHKLLEEIKKGNKKSFFKTIDEKATPASKFTPLPVPKNKRQKPNQQAPAVNAPKLEEFQVSGLNLNENELLGLTSRPSYSSTPILDKNFNKISENDYLAGVPETDIRTKFHQRMQEKGVQPVAVKNEGQVLHMTEEEFKKKVISISKQVAEIVSKQMIKNVIIEYAKAGQDIIVESKKIKKAEIVDKNKVKIDGKVYKLTLVA
jgi:hypothetical protein